MINRFSFVHNDFLIPVMITGIILFACFVYKEWITTKGRVLTVNIIVAFLAISALALLVLEPTRLVEIKDQHAILLTDGYSKTEKDSLVTLNEGIKVLEYDSKKAIRTELDSLTHIYLLGEGVRPFDLSKFNHLEVDYLPIKPPSGINRLLYNSSINLGEIVEIKGSYNQPFKGSYMVFEDSRGNGLDSINFNENGKTDFSLLGIPKTIGTYIFNLTVKDSIGNFLESFPLPIQIKEKSSLRILMLNNFPTFETKYLKNFLAEEGHEVIVRSQMTKGKFKFEYFNTKNTPIYSFTDTILNKLDLVIADAETYFNFGKTSRGRFEKSIKENGLGLFIQPSELSFNLPERLTYFKFIPDGIDEVQLYNNEALLDKYPYAFDMPFLVEPILITNGQTIAANKNMGMGNIATATFLNSYQLILSGKGQTYQSIWTQIVDNLAKKKAVSVAWEIHTELPKTNEPFDFSLYTNLKAFDVVNEEGVSISIAQNPLLPNKYAGIVYPKRKGWNTLTVESDTTSQLSYFVYDDTDWKSLQTTKTITANTKYFKTSPTKTRTVTKNHPISPILFYVLFLIGSGWLWLSPKVIKP